MATEAPRLARTVDELCDDALCALVRGHDGWHDPAFDDEPPEPEPEREKVPTLPPLDPSEREQAPLFEETRT